MFICSRPFFITTHQIRVILYCSYQLMERHNSIILVIVTALNLHAHVWLLIFNLIHEISFKLSLGKHILRGLLRLLLVVKHSLKVYIIYFDLNFTLRLCKVDQWCILLSDVKNGTTTSKLNALAFFLWNFFSVENNQLWHTFYDTKTIVLFSLNRI